MGANERKKGTRGETSARDEHRLKEEGHSGVRGDKRRFGNGGNI